MNSNKSNQDQGQSAAEAHEIENQPTVRRTKPEVAEPEVAEPEVIVTDKRRVTLEGEVIPDESEQESQETSTSGALSEVELLHAKLKEVDEKRLEANGK